MVCRECEKSIARNSNYCKYCGTKVEKYDPPVRTVEKSDDDSSLIYKVIEVSQQEADEGAERVLDFAGALEPLHIIFPKLFCTGQLFMVKKCKFLNSEGKLHKKSILIKVNIA